MGACPQRFFHKRRTLVKVKSVQDIVLGADEIEHARVPQQDSSLMGRDSMPSGILLGRYHDYQVLILAILAL